MVNLDKIGQRNFKLRINCNDLEFGGVCEDGVIIKEN